MGKGDGWMAVWLCMILSGGLGMICTRSERNDGRLLISIIHSTVEYRWEGDGKEVVPETPETRCHQRSEERRMREMANWMGLARRQNLLHTVSTAVVNSRLPPPPFIRALMSLMSPPATFPVRVSRISLSTE